MMAMFVMRFALEVMVMMMTMVAMFFLGSADLLILIKGGGCLAAFIDNALAL